MTSPTDYPINDGSFRNLTIVPPETVVSAMRLARMCWSMTSDDGRGGRWPIRRSRGTE